MKKEYILNLMKKNIVDFNELVLNNYYKMGLDETEAIIIIKLYSLLKRNITFINPERLSKILSISKVKTSNRLESLIEKGYIQMDLVTLENGKETESFNLDYFIEKVLLNELDQAKGKKKENNKADEGILAEMLELEMKKPLSVLDIQIITKWLKEDSYSFDQIEDALFKAVKSNKVTMKYIDNILLKSLEEKPVYKREKKSVMKDFSKLWKE